MDKTNAVLYEAKIHADENRSKDVRHFSASVVEAIEELQGQLHDAEESNKAVERALEDVDYRGSYADGVMYLKGQLATALAACEAKGDFLQFAWRDVPMSEYAFDRLESAIAIKPDASALKTHDDALIERCAAICDEYADDPVYCGSAIRELKGCEASK